MSRDTKQEQESEMGRMEWVALDLLELVKGEMEDSPEFVR